MSVGPRLEIRTERKVDDDQSTREESAKGGWPKARGTALPSGIAKERLALPRTLRPRRLTQLLRDRTTEGAPGQASGGATGTTGVTAPDTGGSLTQQPREPGDGMQVLKGLRLPHQTGGLNGVLGALPRSPPQRCDPQQRPEADKGN